jgi:putative peptidoglycan binding protein
MATGKELLTLARKHVGESYVLGALAPKDNAGHKGPWDCAEFASWLVFQVSAQLYGCADNTARPAAADAFTGFWARDAAALGRKISVDEAAATAGALVLRAPGSAGIKIGHIAVSDGAGGTVEAHSTKRGVIASTLAGRVWDTGVLVPWMVYSAGSPVPLAPPPATVLRLTDPPMKGSEVKEIQRLLKAAGFAPGPLDGVYGEQTVAAVQAFQIAKGLLPDGEAGPATKKALERAAG